MTAIFISHRSSDNAEAQKLKERLGTEGYEQLFLDFDPADGIPAGVDWEQRLYQELRRCQALLIVLTPAWLESCWCWSELAIAREKGKAVFVVRVKECPGGRVIPANQEVDLTRDRAAGLEKLARGLREHGLDPRDAFDWKPGRPIYPGLAAFDVDDAAIFFGRSAESWEVVEELRRLRIQATGSRKLLMITGASGSGKSSLMRAGVLARLRKEPASWITARPFRRGNDAMGALAEALVWAFLPDRRPSSLDGITLRLAGPDGAGELLTIARDLRLTLERPEATLVLALDQAEELLAAERADDAAKLLDLFRATLAVVSNEILVIATIRSDRLGSWQQHGSIKATADHGELPFEPWPLGPMPMERIGEIVREPAKKFAGLEIDDDLVDALRADMVTPDALPLLAFTLSRLFDRRRPEGRLELQQYEALGRLEGAIREEAEWITAGATEQELDALHAAFVPHLVRSNPEGSYSRRRGLWDKMPEQAKPVLNRLIDARLLVMRTDEQVVTVEAAHEALLRTWPRLRGWLKQDREELRLLEGLYQAAQEWEKSGRRDDLLVHRGARLKDVRTLIEEPRFATAIDSSTRDYRDACVAVQEKHNIETILKLEHELRWSHRISPYKPFLIASLREGDDFATADRKAKEASERVMPFVYFAYVTFPVLTLIGLSLLLGLAWILGLI
jgi:hypothetical protein